MAETDHPFQEISISAIPFNADHAEALGLLFKLSYHLPDPERPQIEICLHDEEARAREWKIYGPSLDFDDPRGADVRFSMPGEEIVFRIAAARYGIRFDAVSDAEFTYPNGSKEPVKAYTFSVKPLP